jgi:penicillin-binding protein 1A
MVGNVVEGIASDASLGERPVAGKTGTSENFFDAWFVGYTPQLLTGLWMGYAEGGQTLEYDLEYARELNGLYGGITPAMIWKAYMEQVLEGVPIEKFEGVEMPEKKDQADPQDSEAPNAPVPTASESRPGGTPQVEPANADTSSAGPSTVAPGSASPSSAGPSSVNPSRSSASPAPLSSSAPPRR